VASLFRIKLARALENAFKRFCAISRNTLKRRVFAPNWAENRLAGDVARLR